MAGLVFSKPFASDELHMNPEMKFEHKDEHLKVMKSR